MDKNVLYEGHLHFLVGSSLPHLKQKKSSRFQIGPFSKVWTVLTLIANNHDYIILFFYFTLSYYFSEENLKKIHSNRTNIAENLDNKSLSLPFLSNDTNNVIEFNSGFNSENKSKRNFWDLIKKKWKEKFGFKRRRRVTQGWHLKLFTLRRRRLRISCAQRKRSYRKRYRRWLRNFARSKKGLQLDALTFYNI